MTDRQEQKPKPVELAEVDLDATQGAAARKSTDLAPSVEARRRDRKGGATNGSPVFDLPEDFAP